MKKKKHEPTVAPKSGPGNILFVRTYEFRIHEYRYRYEHSQKLVACPGAHNFLHSDYSLKYICAIYVCIAFPDRLLPQVKFSKDISEVRSFTSLFLFHWNVSKDTYELEFRALERAFDVTGGGIWGGYD